MLGLALVTACGSSSGASSGAGDAGAVSDGGAASDAGGASDGGVVDSGEGNGDGSSVDAPGGDEGNDADSTDTGSGGDGTAGSSYFGKVLFEYFTTATVPTYSLLVKIAPTGVLGSVNAWPPGAIVVGSCCYIAPASPDAGAEDLVSAGTITLSDNGSPLATIPYGAQGYDAASAVLASYWSPGDVLSGSAPGAVAAAFTGMVGAPEVLSLTDLSLTATVSVSAPWTITWTPRINASAHLVADLFSSVDGEIKCVADDSAASVTFPTSLLGKIKSTDTGTLLIARSLATTLTAANTTIELAALTGEQVSVTFGP